MSSVRERRPSSTRRRTAAATNCFLTDPRGKGAGLLVPGSYELTRTRSPPPPVLCKVLFRAAVLAAVLLLAELGRDGRQEAREGAERRAALDVEAVLARHAEGEARAEARGLP